MYWGCVVYAGVLAFSAVYYFAHSRKTYTSPVTLMRRNIVDGITVDAEVKIETEKPT
jgi:hypothetical protein